MTTTFDPRSWDFDTQTGPLVDPVASLTPPVFVTAPGKSSSPLAYPGDLDSLTVASLKIYDASKKFASTDSPTSVNIEGWPAQITNCTINCSVVGDSGTTTPVLIDHCVIDNTKTVKPNQGVLNKIVCEVGYSQLHVSQDGMYVSDYTRQVVFNRYAAGDFSDPYATKLRYSHLWQSYSTYGDSTWIPAKMNYSFALADYPDPSKVVGYLAPPITDVQKASALTASTTAVTAAHVGDFVNKPAEVPGAYSATVFGGMYQVIGSLGPDRSPVAPVWIATDYQRLTHKDSSGQVVVDQAGWPQNTALMQPFLSGTAIMVYLGGSNHSDASQMSRSNGHTLWYRSRIENFSNAGAFICQPTVGPSAGAGPWDPTIWPTSYLRVEGCDILLKPPNALAFIQGHSVPDPYSGVAQYPPYGFNSAPRWVTFIDNYVGNIDGSSLTQSKKFFAHSDGDSNLVVSSEARRYTGVLAQLDATGTTMMTAVNGGTLPSGPDVAASPALQAMLRQVEYTNHIIVPTDGANGTPNNSWLPVFAARRDAKISKMYLDARNWVVWQNNRDRATGAPMDPSLPLYNVAGRPWLAKDGSDLGYYTGSA